MFISKFTQTIPAENPRTPWRNVTKDSQRFTKYQKITKNYLQDWVWFPSERWPKKNFIDFQGKIMFPLNRDTWDDLIKIGLKLCFKNSE